MESETAGKRGRRDTVREGDSQRSAPPSATARMVRTAGSLDVVTTQSFTCVKSNKLKNQQLFCGPWKRLGGHRKKKSLCQTPETDRQALRCVSSQRRNSQTGTRTGG